jgi:hypothetical protein
MVENLTTQVYEAFGSFKKPQHSTNYTHCEECAEHDALLANVTRKSLSIDHIGTVAWSPVPFLVPEAMAYYFPRLAELAMLNVVNKEGDPYILQFINTMSSGPHNQQFVLFEKKHRQFVSALLQLIHQKHGELIRSHSWTDTLDKAILEWSRI